MTKFKLKKNDEVIIIAGKDKGKIGKIISLSNTSSKVLVSGVNIIKKHVKPSQQDAGGIVQKESYINISNVAYFDVELGKATKLGYKTLSNGDKVRYSKKSGKIIDQKIK